MDKFPALKALGVEIDFNAEPLTQEKLALIFNDQCSKYCSDDGEDAKKLFFVEYMHKKLKEKYADKPDRVNFIFSGLVSSCKKFYKASREMKLYLQLLEKNNFGTRKSCKCYMSLRKTVFESLGRKVEHGTPLQGVVVPPQVVENFSQHVKIDAGQLKAEITKQGGDLNSLGGPELALAVVVVYNNTKSSKDTPSVPQTSALTVSGASNATIPANYEMENYKKISFAEKVNGDRDDNLYVLGDLLFKLYGDPKFNESIQTSVAGSCT